MAYSQHILVCSSNQPTYPGPVCLSANCLNWISLGDRKNHHIMPFERINFQIENATKLTENELNKQEGGTTERYGDRGRREEGSLFCAASLGRPYECRVKCSVYVWNDIIFIAALWFVFFFALAKIRNVLNASNNCKGIKWYAERNKYVKNNNSKYAWKTETEKNKVKTKRSSKARQLRHHVIPVWAIVASRRFGSLGLAIVLGHVALKANYGGSSRKNK